MNGFVGRARSDSRWRMTVRRAAEAWSGKLIFTAVKLRLRETALGTFEISLADVYSRALNVLDEQGLSRDNAFAHPNTEL